MTKQKKNSRWQGYDPRYIYSLVVRRYFADMKTKIDNEVFHEWCDSLILCQSDRSLKSTLTPIVNKLSDMRVVNADLEYLITGPRKEFISMVVFLYTNNESYIKKQCQPALCVRIDVSEK